MCTLTYYRNGSQKIVTFNRDEHFERPMAKKPIEYNGLNGQLIYPKDHRGGTWIVLKENGDMGMLLNGAEEKHIRGNYARSRGLILLEMMRSRTPLAFWEDCYLEDIEPFTIVFIGSSTYQLQWDGLRKSHKTMDRGPLHTWSSATLFDRPSKQKKKNELYKFLAGKMKVTPNCLLNFHSRTDLTNLENGIVIKRPDGIETRSITQIVSSAGKHAMKYFGFRPYRTSIVQFESSNHNERLAEKVMA